MTDAPEGPPAEGEPERGSRRSPRVGGSGSPVGSTLSIVLAVIAVVAGFLILRAITDDSEGDAGLPTGTVSSAPQGTTAGTRTGATNPSGGTSVGPSTTAAPTKTGATVSVANASGIAGSAAAMSTALKNGGYTMGQAGNTTGERLNKSVVFFVGGNDAAQSVATSVAGAMGGLDVQQMPTPPPIKDGLGTSTVLVMIGTDTANKTLDDLAARGGATPPSAAGVTTTTAAG